MAFNLSRAGKVTRISNAVAAGTTAVTSAAIDMKGFDSCTFIVAFGTITTDGVQSVKAQQSSDNDADTYADLLGTSITVADDDDNQLVVLDIDKPRERYLKCVVSRATQNAVVDGIFAIQYNAQVQPVTHDVATVVGSEFHHAPAEGTA
jgi:hypothetical protein